MSNTDYESLINGRTNKYETRFFHMYLKGDSPVLNGGLKAVSKRDHASFIHEYIHYLQQITTPFGLKINWYFLNSLLLYREYVDFNTTLSIPVPDEANKAEVEFRKELHAKAGSKFYQDSSVDEVNVNLTDIETARLNDTAVNIGVYDFTLQWALSDGFNFGYTCVMEGMAHLVQSLINSELTHSEVPYQAAQLICNEIRPDIKENKKLLISICYIALFFDNPGVAFFDILRFVDKKEHGISLFRRYMTQYTRTFDGEQLTHAKMMQILMDNFIERLEALLGYELVHLKDVIDNCKYEVMTGDSTLLRFIYERDLSTLENLDELLDFYSYPAIDSADNDLVVPLGSNGKPLTETGILLSLELIHARFKEEKGEKECIRFPICDRQSRDKDINLIDENCAGTQWDKKIHCLFTGAMNYWKLADKTFIL
ncbi:MULTISPECIES: hypothetical protein [unclassified Mucilaginibacter]|uniref:hypothetical protein n=1 Tax=unclassified Mucilaginibacter TaxID=2617802 RepID=UPI002B23DB75|nr:MULTISPECIES: hypothetical protein [unclassified Mucilaginibacter]MEB0262786.1 hypothetical protein [Mucilaginibacter sp. 10I4]MEB0278168.1 hypothetical protein [Mucilaginibacter sp. 10B2]